MFSKLDAIRREPKEKASVGMIILGFFVVFVLGLFSGALDWIVYTISWLLTQSSIAVNVSYELSITGFYLGIDILILFFIAMFSRTPIFSSLHTLTFFLGYALIILLNYYSRISLYSLALKKNYITKLVLLAIFLVLFTIFNYFMWYAKGKGKLADILSAVAVAGMIVLIAIPAYTISSSIYAHNLLRSDVGYSSSEILTIILAIISMVTFIAFAIIMAINLKNDVNKRKKSLVISIPCGVLVGAGLFLLINFTTPITTSPLIH